MNRHLLVPGDHARCSRGQCRVTRGLCCGGQDAGICDPCDDERDVAAIEQTYGVRPVLISLESNRSTW